MALTLGNWLFIILVGIFIAGFIAVCVYAVSENGSTTAIVAMAFLFVWVIGLMVGLSWYNTSTASGMRAYKDYESNMDNGINREITITSEDGRLIFHYEGKVDIESNHTDNYIKFEGEDGKRYMIYYGIQDTITIIEK